ncbi:MAG: alpha/beta hydrolase, partial [Chloroflexota bacterium]
MPFVAHDTARIWYDDGGDGPPVLLVHGGLFDPMDGERFWGTPGIAEDVRARGYRVLIPDRRFSTGRTTSTFTTHSWDIEATDLAKVITDAGVAKVHLIAGSNGCSAAIRLALSAPQHIRSLVLCWPATPDNDSLGRAFNNSA